MATKSFFFFPLKDLAAIRFFFCKKINLALGDLVATKSFFVFWLVFFRLETWQLPSRFGDLVGTRSFRGRLVATRSFFSLET